MKTPEFKQKMGDRSKNDDGFTYCYGKFDGYNNDHRHKELIKRCRRSDKRSVKTKELKRMLDTEEIIIDEIIETGISMIDKPEEDFVCDECIGKKD